MAILGHLDRLARRTLRATAWSLPWLYNFRNEHFSVVQRLRGGVHDEDVRVLRFLDVSEPVVIDVGANVGQTLLSIKSLHPTARVICVEPSLAVLPRLIRSARPYQDVEIAPVAASDSHSILRLYLPHVKGVTFSQYASLLEIDKQKLAETLTSSGFRKVDQRDIKIQTYYCATLPLDDLVSECDVLKVDAEGFENRVIAGATKLITGSLPVVIIERPSDTLRDRFSALGYITHSIGPVNTVYVHPSRMRGLPEG